MAAALRIDLKMLNAPEIQKKMNRLEPRLQKKVMKKALRESFKIVLAAARTGAPKGATGLLGRKLKLRAD